MDGRVNCADGGALEGKIVDPREQGAGRAAGVAPAGLPRQRNRVGRGLASFIKQRANRLTTTFLFHI
jgi:hypothetical protein